MVAEQNMLDDLLSSAGQQASAVSNQVESWVQGSLSVKDIFQKPLVTQEQINSLSDSDRASFEQIKAGVQDKFNKDTSVLERWAAEQQGVTAETGANTVALIVVENGRKAKDNSLSFLIDAVQEKAAQDGWGKALIAGSAALFEKATSYITGKEPNHELLNRATEMAVKNVSLDNGRILSGLMDSKVDAIKIAQGIESAAVAELGIKEYKSVFTSQVVKAAKVSDGQNSGSAIAAKVQSSGRKYVSAVDDEQAVSLNNNIIKVTEEYREGLVAIGYTDEQALTATKSLYENTVKASPHIRDGESYDVEYKMTKGRSRHARIDRKDMRVETKEQQQGVVQASDALLNQTVDKLLALKVVDKDGQTVAGVSNQNIQLVKEGQDTLLAKYTDSAIILGEQVASKPAMTGRGVRKHHSATEATTFAGGECAITGCPTHLVDKVEQTRLAAEKKVETDKTVNTSNETLASQQTDANAILEKMKQNTKKQISSPALEDVDADKKLETQNMPNKMPPKGGLQMAAQ